MSEREVWEYIGGPHDGLLMSVTEGQVGVGYIKKIGAAGSYTIATREDVERKQLCWVPAGYLSDRSTWGDA